MEFVLLPFVLGPMAIGNPLGIIVVFFIFLFFQILGAVFPALRGKD